MNLLIIRIAFLAATAPGLFFVTSDLTNIRIADDTTSIWVLKANESDFPSSAADYDDSSDLYTTTEQAVSQDEPLTSKRERVSFETKLGGQVKQKNKSGSLY